MRHPASMNGAGVIAAGPLGSTKPCSRGAGQSYGCLLQGIEARLKWVRATAFGYICRRDDSAFPCADTSGLSCSHGLIIRFTVLCDGVDIAHVLDPMTPPTCPRCLKPVSLDDTLMFDGAQARHLDCRRPHALSPVELRLLFQHCFDHAVAECASCSQAFRQTELGSDLLSHRTNLCPRCRVDLTDRLRQHVVTCTMLPEALGRTVRESRETTRRLVTESNQLPDRVDVPMSAAARTQPKGRSLQDLRTRLARLP